MFYKHVCITFQPILINNRVNQGFSVSLCWPYLINIHIFYCYRQSTLFEINIEKSNMYIRDYSSELLGRIHVWQSYEWRWCTVYAKVESSSWPLDNVVRKTDVCRFREYLAFYCKWVDVKKFFFQLNDEFLVNGHFLFVFLLLQTIIDKCIAFFILLNSLCSCQNTFRFETFILYFYIFGFYRYNFCDPHNVILYFKFCIYNSS